MDNENLTETKTIGHPQPDVPQPDDQAGDEADLQAAGPAAQTDAEAKTGPAASDETAEAETIDDADEAMPGADGTTYTSGLSSADREPYRGGVRRWVEENPGLAVGVAIGAGVIVGGIVITQMARSAARRRRHPARRFVNQLQRYAGDVAGVIGARAIDASLQARDKAGRLGSQAAHHADVWRREMAHQAEGVADLIADQAHASLAALRDTTDDLSDTWEQAQERGSAFKSTVGKSLQTLLAAAAVKKVADWIRRVV